jgi:hypothetical protein
MTSKNRDYHTEYLRRLKRAAQRGLSKSQARGHAKIGERRVSTRAPPKIPDKRLQISLQRLKSGATLSQAAREGGISSERLRHYVSEHKLAAKRGKHWIFQQRNLRWQALIYTDARSQIVLVSKPKEISKIAKYHNAVKRFLRTKRTAPLNPYVGMMITDASRHHYVLETDPNALLRLVNTGEPTFEEFYKLIPI